MLRTGAFLTGKQRTSIDRGDRGVTRQGRRTLFNSCAGKNRRTGSARARARADGRKREGKIDRGNGIVNTHFHVGLKRRRNHTRRTTRVTRVMRDRRVFYEDFYSSTRGTRTCRQRISTKETCKCCEATIGHPGSSSIGFMITITIISKDARPTEITVTNQSSTN